MIFHDEYDVALIIFIVGLYQIEEVPGMGSIPGPEILHALQAQPKKIFF